MKRQLRGVNLGGWLVVEKWLTPALFANTDAVDEYTLSGAPEGRRRIRQHRRQFVTERDIVWLAKRGVELVRVPVGYWLFKEEAPYLSGTQELDRCMRWCERHGLQVIIDLHGVPESQNGHDHSGRIGRAGFLRSLAAQDEAIQILRLIADRYGQSPALWGLQLLNEPRVPLGVRRLRQWYRRAYDAVDETLAPDVKVIFSDGFRPRLMNGSLKRRSRAVMDVHHYHFATMWPYWSRLSLLLYRWRLVRRRRLLQRLSRTQPVMIGEWSVVVGQELAVAEDISDEQYRDELIPWHRAAQEKAFAPAVATCYWSYRTEAGEGPWDFRALVEAGILRYTVKNE